MNTSISHPTSQTNQDTAGAEVGMVTAPEPEPETYTESVAKKAHDVIDRASAKAAQAEQSLVQTAGLTEERARELGEQAQRSSKQTLDTVQTYVRSHPLESLGIAFVSGVVISKLLQR